MSHLLGVYPGDLVTVDDEKTMNAAKVSLNDRGDNAIQGEIAQRLNTWARTGDETTHIRLYRFIYQKRYIFKLGRTPTIPN